MLRIVAGALLTLAACQDPIVSVAVTVPAAPRPYADLVASLSVTVLAPEDPSIDCDALAFGRVDADAIALSQVTGVTFQDGATSAPISGVPRLGAKLWLAEGRDASGNLLVAGCTPLGDIDQDTDVTIDTEPAAQITLGLHQADNPVPDTLDVTVDDGLVPPDPLPGRAVHWDVYGAAAEHGEGDAAVDSGGVASLALAAPSFGGPASIQVRARWARTQPAVVPAFEAVAPAGLSINRACTNNPLDLLTVDTADWHPFHVDGHDALAGLARDATRTHLYVAAWDGSAAVDTCSGDLGASLTTFTTLRASTSDPVDRLLFISANQWLETEVSGTSSLTMTPRAPVGWVNLTGVAPVAIVNVQDCEGTDDVVLAQLIDGKVRAFDVTGQTITSALADQLTTAIAAIASGLGTTPRLSKAGCIAPGDSSGAPLVPAVVLETPRLGDSTVLPRFLVIAGQPTIVLPSFGAVAFSGGSDNSLMAGTLDPSGAKVVRYRSVDGGLREIARADSLGPPASLAYGDIDGDDVPDTIWGLVDAVQGGQQDARLQLELGCGAGDLPLDGVSPPVATGAAAVFLSPDPDHTADLMIGTSRAAAFIDTDLPPSP